MNKFSGAIAPSQRPQPSQPGRSPQGLPNLLPVVLGGVLMGLCPAPVNAWPLAWLALAPLWWTVLAPGQPPQPRQAFGLGLAWSLTYHGMVLSWITALHPLTWMGVPWLGSVAIAAFAWGFITLLGGVTFGVWALLVHLAAVRWTLSMPQRLLLGTALWCSLETLLSWGPLHWPTLAYTQSPGNGWMLHIGQLSGPMGITAAVVLINGCWAAAWCAYQTRLAGSTGSTRPVPSSRKRMIGWRGWVGLGLGVWVGLQGLGGWLHHHGAADDPNQALPIGLIQGNVPTRVKLTPAGIRQAIQGYAEGYRTLVQQGAAAVLTPEGALPELWTDAYQRRNPIYQAVLEQGRILWLGTFRPTRTPDGPGLTQSLITLDGNAQVISQYDKIKLVPLGEYIPLQSLLGGVISRLSPVEGSLLPGRSRAGLATPFGRAIVGICYESAYSDLFQQQAAAGGEWIMTASNNDPYPLRMMAQHHAQDVMRAIETDRWAARVTNTGISGVVTPRGQTAWLAPAHTYVTHLHTLYRRQTRTPYVRWGDWLTPLLLITSVGMLISVGRRR
jgi:apolipoprotein N-acyltransferase